MSSASSLSQVGAVDFSSSAASAVGQTPGPTDTTDTSPMAKAMQELQDLAKSDPAKFKKAAAEIAEKLKAEAGQATGRKADFLNQLASKFDAASQSGDASGLQPPQQGQHAHHGGGHHHHVHKYAQQEAQGQGGDLASIVQSAVSDVTQAAA
ncbi:MAG: hypothetical protein JST92_16725 [Deltaproteobacteria bacterium]|nr:hypothetical protein [Deltaproteobacteria bacterium]